MRKIRLRRWKNSTRPLNEGKKYVKSKPIHRFHATSCDILKIKYCLFSKYIYCLESLLSFSSQLNIGKMKVGSCFGYLLLICRQWDSNIHISSKRAYFIVLLGTPVREYATPAPHPHRLFDRQSSEPATHSHVGFLPSLVEILGSVSDCFLVSCQ